MRIYFLPNFIAIRFERTKPWAFFEERRLNKNNNKNNKNMQGDQ